MADVSLCLTFLHSFYPLDADLNLAINSRFFQRVNTPLPPVGKLEGWRQLRRTSEPVHCARNAVSPRGGDPNRATWDGQSPSNSTWLQRTRVCIVAPGANRAGPFFSGPPSLNPTSAPTVRPSQTALPATYPESRSRSMTKPQSEHILSSKEAIF